MEKLLFLLCCFLVVSFAVAQPEAFKYRVYKGGKTIYMYNNTGSITAPATIPPASAATNLGRRTKFSVTAKNDTLYLNLWLQGGIDVNNTNTYFFSIQNRNHQYFQFANFEISALTAPVKFRFGDTYNGSFRRTDAANNEVRKDTTINVLSSAVAQVNLNVNFAVRFGLIDYSYDKYSGMKAKATVSGVFGGFLGFGVLETNDANTSSRLFKNDTIGVYATRTVPTFSTGLTLGVNIRGLEFVILSGYEIPMVKNIYWDYRRKPFVGFGIGYGSSLFK